jgi:DNA-binding transcriptional ArsR family regulator
MSPRRESAGAAVSDAAPVFFALGDATRLTLVARLCREGPLAIATLSAEADVSRQAVTKHLHALADAGLVRCRSHGGRRQRLWELQPRRLLDAQRFLERISRQWDDALDRLRAFVEE